MAYRKNGTMPVLEHFAELRLRLIIVASALFIASVISFAWMELIMNILTVPLDGLSLIYLTPPEAFTATLRLSLIAGAILASPIIVYEVLAFIFPGLTRNEKIFFMSILSGIVFLFVSGVFFAYFIVFPFTLNFFLQFAGADLDPQFTISEYISFTLSIHFAFGVIFQLPLLTWALGKTGLLSSYFLRRNRKIAFLLMLVVAAMITPPDIASQVIMVLPLLALYETGILMVMIGEKKRLKAPTQ